MKRHYERHSILNAAKLLGVDRKTLSRWLETAGIATEGGITLHEAMAALRAKAERDEPIRRKNIAEARRAEACLADKTKKYMPASLHRHVIADLREQARRKIEAAKYIPANSRQKLLVDFDGIVPMEHTT